MKAVFWLRRAGSGSSLLSLTASKREVAAIQCWVLSVLEMMGEDPKVLWSSGCCFATVVAFPNSSSLR